MKVNWDGYDEEVQTMTFDEYVKIHNLYDVDFLKVDCEGGEYDIFTLENIDFLKQVPKIVVEMHLGNNVQKAKFRQFRDDVLCLFENYHVRSLDGVDIKWDLHNDHFIEYYTDVYIYIDNRK